MIVGVTSGLIVGHFRDTWIDHAGRFGALLLLSVPGFWLAIVQILVFSTPAQGSETRQTMAAT